MKKEHNENEEEIPLGLCQFNFQQVFFACLFSAIGYSIVERAHALVGVGFIIFSFVFYFAVIKQANDYLKKKEKENRNKD